MLKRIILAIAITAGACSAQDAFLPSCSVPSKGLGKFRVSVSSQVASGVVKEKSDFILSVQEETDLAGLKSVKVRFLFDTNGNVACFDVFDQKGAAREDVVRTVISNGFAKWRFKPYTINGQPVDVDSWIKLEHKKSALKASFERE